jgi:hypothetical protein
MMAIGTWLNKTSGITSLITLDDRRRQLHLSPAIPHVQLAE